MHKFDIIIVYYNVILDLLEDYYFLRVPYPHHRPAGVKQIVRRDLLVN